MDGEAVEDEGPEAEGGADVGVAVGGEAGEGGGADVTSTGGLDEEIQRDGVGQGGELDTRVASVRSLADPTSSRLITRQ